MTGSAFRAHLEELRTVVEAALAAELASRVWPDRLREAVQYSLMAGGKRLRPLLVLLANEVCGGKQADAIAAACAIEMIHTYSLIHDDLPSMDDDDFRRGRPTSHKVFGEAMAILAGDCLLTLAFETMAQSSGSLVSKNAAAAAEMTRVLAVAAGGSGMVGGQVLDLEAERGESDRQAGLAEKAEAAEIPGCLAASDAVGVTRPTSVAGDEGSAKSGQNESNRMAENRVERLIQIHRMKTGALIAASLELGAITAFASLEDRSRLRVYGHCIGLAFQIADDLLDVTGDPSRLGKTPGRDADLGKLTYPSLLGIEPSRVRAQQLVTDACEAVDAFGDGSVWLKDLAAFIVERDH